MKSSSRAVASRTLAVLFGVGLGIGEIIYNWGQASWWPFILVDYLAVALLLVGAFRSPRILAAGWGFTCAMFYMAYFFTLNAGESPMRPAALIIGIPFVFSIFGLALAVWPERT